MSRLLAKEYAVTSEVPLPVIQWSDVDASAPARLSITTGQLPQADVALITWTSAEWSALDHVFLNSQEERYPDQYDWRDHWQACTPSGASTPLFYYQLVGINSTRTDNFLRVLLVKSEVHLAHDPYITGVDQLVETLIEQTGVNTIISTGTAGGSSISQSLGDVMLTTRAHINLEKPENLKLCGYNNQTITGFDFFFDSPLYTSVQKKLMLPLNRIWDSSAIAKAISELNNQTGTAYTQADLIIEPLQPSALIKNQINFCPTQPLLTTDYYFISQGKIFDEYCFLEMDDAVIAHQCSQKRVGFGFIRNVSDPIVTETDASGKVIPEDVREDWSGIVYQLSGFYTSFNSALTSWAAIRCNI